MDGRDQPDTNVVRIRRKGDPSEAERRRLAGTIFAEQDDVGTFSRGNLVPPPADHPTEPPDDDRPTADPYFENLQRPRGGDEQGASAVRSDSETTAYFDQLTTQSAAEMASMVDAPSVEPAMPGSAQLPAELALPTRRRIRKRPARANSVTRLVRPAILATLAATLAGGVAFAAILTSREQPRPHARNTPALASSEPPALAALQTAFTAIQRRTAANAIAERNAPVRRRAQQPPTRRRRAHVQPPRRGTNAGTHLILAADHTPTSTAQTIATRPSVTADPIATSSTAEPQQPSYHAAASNQPANPPAGPSGLGQVVGNNCDPKCK